ncbi:MAG: DUF58 domain-containing protein [Candidatus Latescibacterota bacterium]|nr:MAG: DUF58 domain-containing protein [Candidatus Latescibacterota bacterium]
MLPKELIQKVRRIEIRTRSLVESLFSGEYHSVFKGRGMEFDQVREYQDGDDVRAIDWNVTARMNRPFVKEFVEERELVVMLLVDVSASSDFGSARHFKSEIAAEICSLLAFSAIQNNDKVGLLLFSDRVEKYLSPRKGRKHVLRVIRELLYFEPEGRGTDLSIPLDHLNRLQKRRAVVFFVSDFLGGSFGKLLRVTNRRHDVIAVRVADPRERDIPDVGHVELEDAETGERLFLSTRDRGFRAAYAESRRRSEAALRSVFRAQGVDLVEVGTDGEYVDPLVRFFRERERRRRR